MTSTALLVALREYVIDEGLGSSAADLLVHEINKILREEDKHADFSANNTSNIDMLEEAWSIISLADEWDSDTEWRRSAIKFREKYFGLLTQHDILVSRYGLETSDNIGPTKVIPVVDPAVIPRDPYLEDLIGDLLTASIDGDDVTVTRLQDEIFDYFISPRSNPPSHEEPSPDVSGDPAPISPSHLHPPTHAGKELMSVAYYTTDGHKPAPYPNMTDEELADFEAWCDEVDWRPFTATRSLFIRRTSLLKWLAVVMILGFGLAALLALLINAMGWA